MEPEPTLVDIPCPICGSGESRHLFDTRDYVFQVSPHTFGVRECQRCGAGYLSPRPPASEIGRYYPEAFYWSWEGGEGQIAFPEIVAKRQTQLRAKSDWLKDQPPGRLLDIGAQKGEFLWYMRERGWQVQGVEMDEKVPNPAQLPIRYGDFLEMDFGEERFDAITFWAVLEHVYEPARFIEKASNMLKPGGRLVVLVTNLNSIQSRWYQADDYPRHLTLFTQSSVKQLCAANRLQLQRLSTDQQIFGGSLSGGLVYAIKRALGYSTEQAMTEWKQLDDADRFWCQWRGRPSALMKLVSRIDRVLTWPVEKVLDRLGHGFILTFSAVPAKRGTPHG